VALLKKDLTKRAVLCIIILSIKRELLGGVMNIFKKFFNLFKKKEKKQEECWYNNVDEQEKSKYFNPDEAGALSDGNCRDCHIAMDIARR
jgi:hypothetical protein